MHVKVVVPDSKNYCDEEEEVEKEKERKGDE